MRIRLHSGNFWPMLGGRVWLDNHSFGIHLHAAPLLDFDVEVYYVRNYWVHRGVFVAIEALSILTIESCTRPGEKAYEDDEPLSSPTNTARTEP